MYIYYFFIFRLSYDSMCQEKEREMESLRQEIKQLQEEDEKRRQVNNNNNYM